MHLKNILVSSITILLADRQVFRFLLKSHTNKSYFQEKMLLDMEFGVETELGKHGVIK